MTDSNKHISFNSKKGENPFSVPNNYFDNLEERFMEDIKKEEGNFKVPVIKMMKPYLYMVAGFLLLFAVGRAVLNNIDTLHNERITSEVLSAEQEMELIYSEVDDFTITNYLLENDLIETE